MTTGSDAADATATAEYDALVVGAGPAGAAAASTLVGQGHRVVVVDRDDGPGGKACGELVTPKAVHAFAQCGVPEDELARFHRDHPSPAHRRRLQQLHALAGPRPLPRPRLRGAPPRPRRAARRPGRRGRRHGAARPRGHRADRQPRVRPRRPRHRPRRRLVRGAGDVHGRGRRCEQPVRSSARHLPRADLAVGDRPARRLPVGAPRRRRGRARARARRSSRHADQRLRLVVPARRRHGERRRDDHVDVAVVPGDQPRPPARPVRRRARPAMAPRPTSPSTPARAVASRSARRSGPTAGPTYLVVGDAAGAGNPLSGAGIEYAIETGHARGRGARRGAAHGRRDHAPAVPAAARRAVRVVLPGGPVGRALPRPPERRRAGSPRSHRHARPPRTRSCASPATSSARTTPAPPSSPTASAAPSPSSPPTTDAG